MREVAERLAMQGLAAQQRLVDGDRPLHVAGALERKRQVVQEARVLRGEQERLFVFGDRRGKALLLSIQVAEMEVPVRVARVQVDRVTERLLGGHRVALAQ